MVEGAHQVLDGVSSDQRQGLGDRLDAHDIINQLACLRIVLGADFIWVGIKEGAQFTLQVRYVLFGPFEF